MSAARYSEYKYSGLEWLGDVPEHWSVARFKRLLSEPMMYGANESADDDTQSNPRFVRITDIAPDGSLRDDTFRSLPPDVAKPYLLNEGDILLARSGATVGKSFIYRKSWGVCCFAGYLIKARPDINVMDPQYLYYCCQSSFYWQYINSEQIQATIQNVSAERYGNFSVPCPSLEEQAVIVSFLDQETTKIDVLVEEQERLIALLKEKRQAVISHAVTKGIDPGVPMKDFGIEWLGEVPAHWEVVPSTWLFSECKDLAHAEDQHLSATQKYGVIPLEEFESLEGRQVTHAVRNLEKRKHVEIDNFVISMRSFEGGIERVKARGCVRSSYVVLVAQGKAHIGFFSYLFKCSSYIQGLQATASFIRDGQDLSYRNFRQVKLPCPSIDEQRQIADFLDQTVAHIGALITETQRGIDLLKERRSALISAVVTGKIDVRGLVAEEVTA